MAALAAAGVASAQSSVTIYGTIDASAGQLKRTLSETGSASTTQKVSTMGGLNSTRGSNALGFRGTEDLGGGLRANFQLEFGTALNNVANNGNATVATLGQPVANGSPFAQVRQGWVGLGGSFGEIRVGSQNSQLFFLRGYSAAFQETGIGGSALAQLNGNATIRNPLQLFGNGVNPTFSTNGTITGLAVTPSTNYLTPNQGVTGAHPRYSNVLSYATPTINGLRGNLAVVRELSENGVSAGLAADAAVAKLQGYILGLDYDNGPLSLKFAYTQKKQEAGRPQGGLNTNLASASTVDENKVDHYAVGGSFNLGAAAPYIIYEKGSNKFGLFDGAASTLKLSTDGYELGARFPMGALTPFVSIARGDWKATEVGSATDKVKMNTYQVGTTYAMSKRTTLYAAVGQSKFKATTDGVAGEQGDKQRGFRLGVTHTF